MQPLGGGTVIAHTFNATESTGLFQKVFVATDSEVIEAEISRVGGTSIRTRSDHESGTDRIAEAVRDLSFDVVVNVQGDTPFINKAALEKLLQLFRDPSVQVASLMDRITDEAALADPNVVKVCVNKNGDSLFFSRSLIPYPRNKDKEIAHYRHIGVYAFRKEALRQFTQWPVSDLEDAEKIECLRFLENGIPLRMAVTEPIGVDINTPEDLAKAQASLRK